MGDTPDQWDDYSEGVLAATVPKDAAGARLDRTLAELFPDYSRNRLQAWIDEGRVLVDQQPRLGKYRLFGGEQLLVKPAAQIESLQDAAEDIPLQVVHADADIIVVDKPAGLVVHPGSGVPNGTLLNALLFHFPETSGVPRAGIVHRLDRDTSGLLVIGRTLSAQTRLVDAMKARSIGRRYTALATGRLDSTQQVDAPIGRDPAHRTRMAVVPSGREARTLLQPIESLPGSTLLDCQLDTGRTHQIRVHCKHIGHPLVGDPVYLQRRPTQPLLRAFPRQALHAAQLRLPHPRSGAECRFESALPKDLRQLLEGLRELAG